MNFTNKDIKLTNKDIKFKDLKENKIYYFTQDEGYSDGILLTKNKTKVLIGHFYLNENDELELDTDDNGINQYALIDLKIIKLLKNGKYKTKLLDVDIFHNIDDLNIWDIYNAIYLQIYSYKWAPGHIETRHEKYFEIIDSKENYTEILDRLF